jgi:hypothetical protein
MLCDVISVVTELMVGVLHSLGVILGFPMLCDAISAVTEFMVRVLHSRSGIGIPDVAGVETQHKHDSMTCLIHGLPLSNQCYLHVMLQH